MADRSIIVRLRAEIDDFRRGMREASDAVERNRQHIDTLSNQAGLMGAAMVAGALVSVRAWANFDEAMSHVQAATHSTGAEMQALTDAALAAGLATQYSATQAAGAIEELAKAGVSAKDIIGGGLAGALSLAAAGGLSVEESAEVAATALKTFGLEGNRVEHVADLMAAGAGKAQGSVHQLGMALKQSALVANATGLTIEETTAGLAAFASAGLLGSDAGTSFKSMLQRLTPQSAEAQRAMDELGISAYDSQGQFIGLANFAGNLQNAMKDLTAEQRNSAMATIFGSDAVRAANVLYTQGAAGIKEWTKNVDDAGYAAETARLRMDNLKGDITTLKGAFENAMIGMGSSSDGVLRSAVQRVTELVRAFAGLPPEVQAAMLAIIGGGGLVLLGVAGMGKLIVAVNNTRLALAALGVTAKTATLALGAIGLIVAAAAVAVGNWAHNSAEARRRTEELSASLDEATGAITANTREVTRNALAARSGWWVFEKESAFNAAEKLSIDLDVLTDAAMGNAEAMETVNKALTRFDGDLDGAGKAADAAGVSLSDYVAAQQTVEEAVRGNNESLTEAIQVAAQKKEADSKLAAGQSEVTSSYDMATRAIQEQVVSLADLVAAQNEAAGVVLSVRDAQRGFEASVDAATDALKENGATLDVGTEKGRANQSALDSISQSGWKLVESMAANGATQEELQGTMQATRDRFIEAAQQFGMTGDEAAALADQLKLIPADVKTTASLNATQARTTAEEMRAKYDGLGRPINTVMSLSLNAASFDRALSVRQSAIAAAGGNTGGGFAEGGWTGAGSKHQVKGVVHAEEFVVKAGPAAANRPMLEALNAGRYAAAPAAPASPSGGGRSSVSLVGATVVVQVGEREFTGYVSDVADGRVVAGLRTAASGRNR